MQYILFPRVYTRPGHEFLLAPGLQYVATERLFLDLSVQLPLSSDVGRGGLASDWNTLASFRFAF